MENQTIELKTVVAEPVTEIEFVKSKGGYNRYTRTTGADYFDTYSWRASIQVKVLNKVFEVICTTKDKQLDDEKLPEKTYTITEELKKQFADFGVQVSLEKVAALYEKALSAQQALCLEMRKDEIRKAYKTNWAHTIYASAKELAGRFGFTLKLDTEEDYIAAQLKDRLGNRNILSIFWGDESVYYQYEDGWFESTHLGYGRGSKIRRKAFGNFLGELASGISYKLSKQKSEKEALAENHKLYDQLFEKACEVFGVPSVSQHGDNSYTQTSIKKLVVYVALANGSRCEVYLGDVFGMEKKDALIVQACGLKFDAMEYVKAIGALKPM